MTMLGGRKGSDSPESPQVTQAQAHPEVSKPSESTEVPANIKAEEDDDLPF